MPFLSPNAGSSAFGGMVVVHQGNDVWLPYNQAVNTGGAIGVSDRAALPGNPIIPIASGLLPLNLVNIGAGNESAVVVIGNTLSRGSTGLNQIGNCDASGRVTLFPAYLNTATNYNTPNSTTVPQFVTALSGFAPLANRQAINVDGYSSAGDGGGGTFVWNATDTRAADGGTIIAVSGIATGRWNRIFSGAMNPRWFGAKGDWNGSSGTDDTAALNAAIAAAGAGGHVEITFPGKYRLTGPVPLTQPITLSMQHGAAFVPNAPDGISSATTKFLYVTSSDVTIDGIAFDYSGSATHTENTRYLIFAAGASAAAHIARVRIRNCSLTNFLVGAYVPPSDTSPSLNVGHGIFCQWVDELLIADNYVSQVSGFAIFTEACDHPTIRGNAIYDTLWAAITLNSGGFGGTVENNRIYSTQPASFHAFDEGGMINAPGTPSDGFGGNYRLVVRGNYCTGYIEYGEAIRVASTSDIDVSENRIENVWGTANSGPTACISVSTRGFQGDSTHVVRVCKNTCIAPRFVDLYQGVAGAGMIGIYAQNPTSGSGSGRADGLVIADNHFISPNGTAPTPIAGTVTLAASASVVFGSAQSLQIGDSLIFQPQPGTVYYVAAVTDSMHVTLTASYTGATGTFPSGSYPIAAYTTRGSYRPIYGAVTTNGTTALSFAHPQTFAAGDAVFLAAETSVVYYIASAVTSGSSATLTAATVSSGATTGSTSTPRFFTQAILVHGNDGGWDNVDIHDNDGSGWCIGTAIIAGFCAVIASGGTNGTVTNARIHHNVFTRLPWTPNDGNQYGLVIGQYSSRVSADHNTVDSFNTPILVSGTGTSDVLTETDTFGGSRYIDSGDYGFEIRHSNGTRTAAFGHDGTILVDGLTASELVATDGSKKLTNVAYTTAATASTVVLRDSSGDGTFVGVICSGAVYLQDSQPIYINESGYKAVMRGNGTFTEWAGLGGGFRWNSESFAGVIATLSETGVLQLSGGLAINGAATTAKPTITGAKLPSDVVLANLLTALAAAGFITDSTT